MNSPVLNRDFQHPADGWYQIEPAGEHFNARANAVQVIDGVALASMSNRFADAKKTPNFPGLLIDHEHFRHDPNKESRAFGWLMSTQARADGLYGQINWSATGRVAVDGGDYRFFSTEYAPKDQQVLHSSPPRRVRPLHLSGLTLTNSPNNKGGKPITNRADDQPSASASSVPLAPSNHPAPRINNREASVIYGLIGDAMKRNGCDRPAAVQTVIARSPELATFLSNQCDLSESQAAMFNRDGSVEYEQVSRIRLDLAYCLRQTNRGTFIDAWTTACQRVSPAFLTNRGGFLTWKLTAADVDRMRERLELPVFIRVRRSVKAALPHDAQTSSPGSSDPLFNHVCRSLSDLLKARPGLSIQQAWDSFGESEPEFLRTMILSQETEPS